MAKIAVFGLGYVGSVTAVCFAAHGHNVIGVDINADKLEMIRNGVAPVAEPGLDDLIRSGYNSGMLQVTSNVKDAIALSDISFITVGTPAKDNSDIDLSSVQKVVKDIGQALSTNDKKYTLVIRSTVLPNTTEKILVPLLAKASKKNIQQDINIFFNPEFLREGTGIADFYNPPYIVIGYVGNKCDNTLRDLWESVQIDAPIIEITSSEAEMLKYTSNAFHALKVTFAN